MLDLLRFILSILTNLASICTIITLAIIILERYEKRRPYLQVSFELLRSNLVCLVIRNVGNSPAKLKSLKLDDEFVKQLKPVTQNRLVNTEFNISLYPNQKFVLCIDEATNQVVKFKNTILNIKMSYYKKDSLWHRKYQENETIDFTDYKEFLVYISETDELKKEIHALSTNVSAIARKLPENPDALPDNAIQYHNFDSNYGNIILTNTSANEDL